ncbi:AAA family ATPase [Chitinimonas sp. BJB300]|uniref:AAA family ATPase n=1 Tax=Chitinimonas sp. BJB300 TaxID=1559339 RepID=UPI000C103830|nr:AAA family ATPase [Chitinimonas sp. BJB300]PHV11937.1 hypothetical protein CSQ89_08420 [Chitinimonas sp. BJB300]TSJ84469.1 AAA family ATPase [Chitinimonas sp. BJB300]
MRLTAEQHAVNQCNESKLIVNAFAGAGKTTTLEAFARNHPNKRMLYLAFNKAVQLEAAERFPSNVEARTTHSLAMSAIGKRYSKKLISRLRLPSIIEALGLPRDYRLAEQVHEVLVNFLGSAVTDISQLIDPLQENRQFLADCAQRLWQLMCEPNDDRIGMLHDGYLKLFQMGTSNNPTFWHYSGVSRP